MAKITPKGKTVTGTKKKDKIVHTGKGAWKTTLTVNAGAGNDLINFKKSKYKNKIYGEAGKDTIYGGKKNDKIYGGKGNDKIYTGKGKNTVYLNKGDGKDTLYHQGSKTTIQINKANAADKTSWVKQGNDLVMTYTRKGVKASKSEVVTIKDYFNADGTIKSDAIWLKNKQNKKLSELFAQQGLSLKAVANKIAGSYLSDKINGTSANETITAGAGNDYVDGGAGNDLIYGEAGVNTLKGGEGADNIYAGSGTDNIYGGAGDDIIYANKGLNNVYINKGEGNDKIRGIEASSKLNLNLGTGLQRVLVYKNGANYVVERIYSDTYSELTTLENFNYDAAKDKVSVIYNGKTVTLSSLYIPNYDPATTKITELGEEGGSYTAATSGKNQIVYGGAGNDTIRTKESDDYINAGEGNNSISSDGGSNTVITGSGDDTININGGDGPNVIEAGDGDNTILSNGSSTITAGAGDDLVTVQGGTAESESYIDVGAGKNAVQMYSLGVSTITGSGDDTIAVWAGGTNVINTGNGEDYIYINEGTNTIDLMNADGTHLTVYDGNSHNTVYGGAGNNTYNFQGGSTNLNVDDHEGQSAYSIGGGSVTISGNGDDVDKVTITGGTNHNITTGGGEDTITINNATGSVIDTGADADSVTISSGASNTTVNAGKGNDSITANGSGNILYGGQGQDTIYANGANGNSTIYGGEKPSSGDYTGSDNKSNTIYAQNGYDNEIYAGNGVSTTEGGQSYIQGDEILVGKNDGSSTNNTIYGGAGRDYVDATYSYNSTINGGGENDTIYTGRHNNIVDGGDGDDEIIVSGDGDNSINGGDGDDYISFASNSGNVEVWGDAGKDQIYDSYAAKTANIHFRAGDGDDTLGGGGSHSAKHTLVFHDIALDDIFTEEKSGNLTITYNNGQDHVYISSFSNNGTPTNAFAYIKVMDGENTLYSGSLGDFVNMRSIYTMTEAGDHNGSSFSDNITGTADKDSIYGNNGNDTIDGGDGNDYLYGGNGNDSLIGGAGNDSLYGSSHDDEMYGGIGNDYFEDYYGNNTMVGGAGNDVFNGTNALQDSSWDTNTLFFAPGDGVDTINYADSYNTLLFDVDKLDDIIVEYDVQNEAVSLRYSDTDRVVLKENNQKEYNVYIGRKDTPNTTHTLQWLLDQRNIIMPVSNYVDASSADEHIYIADNWSNTIIGGSGDDTITSLGELDESGKLDDVAYVYYIFDRYGDGKDVIVNSNSKYNSYILFKYVGSDKEDTGAQEAFLDTLKYTLKADYSGAEPRYDLVITYGSNSSITIEDYNPENPKSSISGIMFAYYNGDTDRFDDFSTSYSFGTYMHITRNEDGTETSIQGANYNELIYGSDGNDTINPGLGNNIVKPKNGADTIEITKHYDSEGVLQSSKSIFYMGTDDVPDTIWLKEVTDPEDEISIYKDNNDLLIQVRTKVFDENYSSGYYYKTYSYIYLKDYFSYVELGDDEPTYMSIWLGTGDSKVETSIYDLYYCNINNDNDNPASELYGTLLRDNVWTSSNIAEYIETGDGEDSISGNSSYNSLADTVYAGAGDDHIEYRSYSDSDPGLKLYGEEGNDHIELSEGTAYGGTGNDYIEVYSYNKNGVYTGATIYGGTGTDSSDSELDEDTLEGSYGNDYIYGSKGKDSIKGDGGSDYIEGGGNDDTIIGDRGADIIYGGDGADLIYSSNTIRGAQDGYADGNGSKVYGGDGDDKIYVSDRDAEIWGNEGNDTIISAYNASATYHLKNTDGNDTIIGPSRGYGEGKIVLEDIVFGGGEGNYINTVLDKENNRFTFYYNSTGAGANITYQNHFTIEHFLDEQGGNYVYDENGNYTYDQYGFYVTEGAHTEIDWYDDLYTGITTIEDKNGKSYNIFSLINMEQIEGATPSDTTIFSDYLIAAEGGATFNMRSGDDIFYSPEGAYTYYVNGNEGNDSLYGSTGNDYFYGDEGDDWLEGGGGANYLWGGEGDDTLESGYEKTPSNGADTLIGGAGANVYQLTFVSPNTGNIIPAIIQSTSADDTIYLRSIESSSNIDEFYRAGDDLLLRYHKGSTTGITNSITIKDWFSNPLNLDVAFYNSSTHGMGSKYKLMNLIQSKYSGSDIKFLSGNVTITSSNQSSYAADILFGTESANTITFGESYNGDTKTVYGLGGNDVIDIYTNYMGSSTVYGGAGNDTISAHGCTHKGFFDGGDGNDSITGGAGNDTIFGGAGADIIDANSGNSHIIFTGERARYNNQFVSDMDLILNYANEDHWDSYFDQLEEAGDITNYVTCAYGGTGAGNQNKIFSIGENSSITLMTGNNDIHVSLANNSRISDVNTAGTNTLKLHDLGPSSSDAAIFMNVKKNGTVDGDIYIAGIYDMRDNWLDNGGEFDDIDGGVVTIAKTSNVAAADVFSTITNYYGGRYLTKANVNSFIEQVASWLSTANNGAGYADVKTALASGEAGELKDLFWSMNYYYNPDQCVWKQNS